MSKLYSILSKLPASLYEDAQSILDAMLISKNLIGWDADLRLIVNDRVFPRTNIADLLAHVLYPYDSNIDDPPGFEIFVNALKSIGLESEWVQNDIAKEILENANSSEEEKTSSSEDENSEDSISVDGDDENKENGKGSSIYQSSNEDEEAEKQYDWKSISDDDDDDTDSDNNNNT